MAGLYAAWYKNYPQTSLHSFNDIKEWKQIDKVGHVYSAYIESKISMEMWRWTGISRKKRIWIGGLSVCFTRLLLKHWMDSAANGDGVAICCKYCRQWCSLHRNLPGTNNVFKWNGRFTESITRMLHWTAAAQKFSKSTSERLLKDYNGQTYWLSTNIRSFFPMTYTEMAADICRNGRWRAFWCKQES